MGGHVDILGQWPEEGNSCASWYYLSQPMMVLLFVCHIPEHTDLKVSLTPSLWQYRCWCHPLRWELYNQGETPRLSNGIHDDPVTECLRTVWHNSPSPQETAFFVSKSALIFWISFIDLKGKYSQSMKHHTWLALLFLPVLPIPISVC